MLFSSTEQFEMRRSKHNKTLHWPLQVNRLRKAVGLVLFLFAGILFALLLAIVKSASLPTEFSKTELISFVIGLLIIVIALTIIYIDEVKKHKDDSD